MPVYLLVNNTKSIEDTWMKRLETVDQEQIKKMSEKAVKRQIERENWNPEHLKGALERCAIS